MDGLNTLVKYLTEAGTEPVEWLGQLASIAVIAVSLQFVLQKGIALRLRWETVHKNLWRHAMLDALALPLKWAIIFAACLLILAIVTQVLGHPATKWILETKEAMTIFLWAWFFERFVSAVEQNFANAWFREEVHDKGVLVMVARLSRLVIVVAALLIFLEWLGYSINGVLALGGIGGIAISFAAKDMLANFFGGLMIFLDRPFTTGDWIRSPDRNIEGNVEKIGWRTTCVRTFDLRPIYIPNAIFTQIVVENPSRMGSLRINETIGVRHEDVGKIFAIIEDIQQLLAKHPEIDHSRSLLVSFNRVSGTSLDILVDVYTTTTDSIKYSEIKGRILLDVAGIIERHGARMALPASTVYLQGERV